MDDVSKQRAFRNEAVFRNVNEQIDELAREPAAPGYVCECADSSCTQTVQMRHGDYQAVRAGGERRFFVVPGHERPEIERVVERRETYLVVEKT